MRSPKVTNVDVDPYRKWRSTFRSRELYLTKEYFKFPQITIQLRSLEEVLDQAWPRDEFSLAIKSRGD